MAWFLAVHIEVSVMVMIHSVFNLDFRGTGWQKGPETQGTQLSTQFSYNIYLCPQLLLNSFFVIVPSRRLEDTQKLHCQLTKGLEN